VTVLSAAIVGLVLALALTPLVQRLAPRLGAVDRPEERRVHERLTPTAGGLAIYIAFWVALGVAVLVAHFLTHQPLDLAGGGGILIGATLLLGLCLLDDIYGLHPAPRLIGQILVAIIAFQWGVRIEGLTNPLALFGQHSYMAVGWLSGPLTVLWIVFVINAINWLDGLDGLAAGVCAIAAASLAIMAASANMLVVATMGAALAAASLGFLRYNFIPARIFMGDTGAMFLGFVLACLSVMGAFKIPTAIAVVVPLLVLGVPIYDAIATVFRRARAGKPIYNADKTHLHHRLLDRGLTATQTVLLIYAVTILLCLAALGLWFR